MNNDLKKYDMSLTKFKKFFVRYLSKSNKVNDASNIINIYRQKFNIPLYLTKNEISKEKTKALGNCKNFGLLYLSKKLTTHEIKVNINSTHIFYDYENKNKKIKEKVKNKKNYKLLSKKNFSYYIEMFDFAPKIVNIDFSNTLPKLFSDETVFKNKTIIIHSFFHFT